MRGGEGTYSSDAVRAVCGQVENSRAEQSRTAGECSASRVSLCEQSEERLFEERERAVSLCVRCVLCELCLQSPSERARRARESQTGAQPAEEGARQTGTRYGLCDRTQYEHNAIHSAHSCIRRAQNWPTGLLDNLLVLQSYRGKGSPQWQIFTATLHIHLFCRTGQNSTPIKKENAFGSLIVKSFKLYQNKYVIRKRRRNNCRPTNRLTFNL